MNHRMIRVITLTLVAAAVLGLAITAHAQTPYPRVSQKGVVTQTIGVTDVTITYSRPGVKGRVIWGGLVPYDEMWRTGANEATTLELSTDAKIEGHPVKAGRYALFTIPHPDSWTIIINADADQPGIGAYDQTKDVVRFEVKPVEHPFTEWMTFLFPELSQDSATAALRWEKLEVPIRIEADTTGTVLESARSEMQKMNDWRIPYRAARFAFDAETAAEDAMTWVDRSIALEPHFANLNLKARMLANAGRYKEAAAVGQKAVAIGKTEQGVDTSDLEKMVADWSKKK